MELHIRDLGETMKIKAGLYDLFSRQRLSDLL